MMTPEAAWTAECLLAANQALEALYRQQSSVCLALQIARNYRLLASAERHTLKKALWQSLSERWMLSYQLRQHKKLFPPLITGEEHDGCLPT